MPTKILTQFGRWIAAQINGFTNGLARLAATPPREWLPTSVWSTILWFFSAAFWSLGSDSPIKQITASFALLVFSFLASWLTLGATLVLVGFFTITLLIGFARLVPAIDRVWVGVRETAVPRT